VEKNLYELVRDRAGRCCEYCRFPEAFAESPFHLDHIVARQHSGETTVENLAFACCHCNRYKGPNLAAVDPQSQQVVELFNPRRRVWGEHFRWQGPNLIGKTPIGRATIRLLRINREIAVETRELLMHEGVFVLEPTQIHEDAVTFQAA
jgi:HNH endonuclease